MKPLRASDDKFIIPNRVVRSTETGVPPATSLIGSLTVSGTTYSAPDYTLASVITAPSIGEGVYCSRRLYRFGRGVAADRHIDLGTNQTLTMGSTTGLPVNYSRHMYQVHLHGHIRVSPAIRCYPVIGGIGTAASDSGVMLRQGIPIDDQSRPDGYDVDSLDRLEWRAFSFHFSCIEAGAPPPDVEYRFFGLELFNVNAATTNTSSATGTNTVAAVSQVHLHCNIWRFERPLSWQDPMG